MKRFTIILVISLLFVLSLSAVTIFAAGDIPVTQNEGWHEVTMSDLESMQNGSFLLVVYDSSFEYATLNNDQKLGYLDAWMTTYGFEAFGIDIKDDNYFPDWLYYPLTDNGNKPSTDIPTYLIADGGACTILERSLSLRAFRSALADYFGFSYTGELGYDMLNNRIFSGYSTRANSAHLREMRSIETVSVPEGVSETAAEITKGLTEDSAKLKAIYDWVTSHIYYDYCMLAGTEPINVSARYTFENHHSVCEGYARLTKEMCNAVGIPCRMTAGFATGIGIDEDAAVWARYADYLQDEDLDAFAADAESFANHAWKEAYIGGKWIILDTTWGSGNRFEKNGGSYSFISGDSNDLYFDPDLDFFSESHVFWTEQDEDLITAYENGMLDVLAELEPEDIAAGSMAIIVSYDEDGRMLDVSFTDPGEGSIDVKLAEPLRTEAVALSVVDTDGIPVTAAYEGSFALTL